MNATHARPMTAYAALCAAAVVVLAQGVGTPDKVADAVAQAGRPVSLIAHSVTLTATEQLGARVTELGATVASTVVPSLADHDQVVASGNRAPAPGAGSHAPVASHVAPTVTVAPAAANLRVAPAASASAKHAGVHKAHRAATLKAQRAAKKTHAAHGAAAPRHKR